MAHIRREASPPPGADPETQIAASFLLRGRVQGNGVRPAIARLAGQCGLTGTVSNREWGVEVQAEGMATQLDTFESQLASRLPAAAVLESMERVTKVWRGYADFRIEQSSSSGSLSTQVPPDLGICTECLKEIFDSNDRRAGYPFTSCSNCGPRYSIIAKMPFERSRTAMDLFRMCESCLREYTSPQDRRFHAQTIACPECGPQLTVDRSDGEGPETNIRMLKRASELLRAGGVLALQGVGGFQLICDATNSEAVSRLRFRKQRPHKPLAVMAESGLVTQLTERERMLLKSPSNPIVLVSTKCLPNLSPEVSLGLDTVGVMQPTTPLHALLLSEVGHPLVVTSGNRDGDPLEYREAAARQSLAPVADLFLHHDRPILRPIDDSVARVISGRAVSIRAARGISPLPLELRCDRSVLAVGGHQKSAIALSNGKVSVLGPHIGDLDTPRMRERFVEQAQSLMNLFDVLPEFIVHDLHPDYFTTRWAQTQSLPTIGVQHHHAHIAAGMLENSWLDREVLGVALDGTGFGVDGTIWGCEFLRATSTSFERVGFLRPFSLIGGESAIREPWRSAISLVADVCGTDKAREVLSPCVPVSKMGALLSARNVPVTVLTSSMGRLFDAIAVLVLNIPDSTYEGQLAMQLEAACDQTASGQYSLPRVNGFGGLQLDWRPLVSEIVSDSLAHVAPAQMAMKFHRAIAAGIAEVSQSFPGLPVVLGGGCFQNRILTELVVDQLSGLGNVVGLPGRIPPNDGGLAAGQLAIAAARIQKLEPKRRTS